MGNNVPSNRRDKRSKSCVEIFKRKSKPSANASSEAMLNQPNILTTKTHPIEQDYFMLKTIGEGVNGKVNLCQNKEDKKRYAVKKLLDDKNSRREVELQWRASLKCRFIVSIKDVYENKVENRRCLFVVLEYMEGGELFDRLKKRKHFTEHEKEKLFTFLFFEEVAKIMYQICQAVNHLHSMGIAHRDLKPENLLLKSKTENSLIKLCDFGFAKEAHKGLVTPNFTPYYVAPEILSFQKYDISCDIWSLGVIMYILCCGYPPFYSTHGQELSPGMKKRIKQGKYEFVPADWLHVSKEAKELIIGMLETDPEQRLTISDVMKSEWIRNYTNVPKIRLNSIHVMKKEKENWQEYVENMNKALSEMRVNYQRAVNLKDLGEVKNPLLERRKNQKTKAKNLSTKHDLKLNLLMPDYATNCIDLLQESDGLLMAVEKDEKAKQAFKRMQSMPAGDLSPLAAFYYSSTLNTPNVENRPELFK